MLRRDTEVSGSDDSSAGTGRAAVLDAAERTFARFVASSSSVLVGDRFDLHRHEEDQLAWMARGSLELAVGADRWHLRQDHAAWIPAGELHEMRFAEDGELLSVYVDPGHRPAGEGWDRARVLRLDPLGGALLRHVTADDVPSARRQSCFWVLHDLVASASVSHEVIALPHDPRARRVALAIFSDPADPRELAEWAAREAVSAKTIARAFLSDTGTTFREWRIRARLHVALGHLQQGEPVRLVAAAVGYDSVSSFIAAFRSRFGATPGAYVARQRREPS